MENKSPKESILRFKKKKETEIRMVKFRILKLQIQKFMFRNPGNPDLCHITSGRYLLDGSVILFCRRKT